MKTSKCSWLFLATLVVALDVGSGCDSGKASDQTAVLRSDIAEFEAELSADEESGQACTEEIDTCEGDACTGDGEQCTLEDGSDDGTASTLDTDTSSDDNSTSGNNHHRRHVAEKCVPPLHECMQAAIDADGRHSCKAAFKSCVFEEIALRKQARCEELAMRCEQEVADHPNDDELNKACKRLEKRCTEGPKLPKAKK